MQIDVALACAESAYKAELDEPKLRPPAKPKSGEGPAAESGG